MQGAFNNSGLTEITIPSSVRFIGKTAFCKCENLRKVVIEPGDEDLMIGLPYSYVYDEENGSSVDMSKYNGASWIKKVTATYLVADGFTPYEMMVTTTGMGESFAYCPLLTDVTIPKNVKYISKDTFRGTPYKVSDNNEDIKENTPSEDEGSGSASNESASNSSSGSNGTNTSTGSGDSSKEKPKYSNEWVDGKWYSEDGSQTYEGTLKWQNNSTGWWIEDTSGWYPTSMCQKIDGKYYYFNEEGYMASNEWRDGYWLDDSGAWDDRYEMSWKNNSTGWWIEDKTGWYPQSQWQKIDGDWYYFKADGFMATSQYVDGWWVGSDGKCQ